MAVYLSILFCHNIALMCHNKSNSGGCIFAAGWLLENDNALLLVVLLLLLWLWLLVSRRQEEERSFRKTPLSTDELGRAVFMVCLSNDLRGYRSLYINAKEAHDKLGTVADQYLEQRGPSILEHAFEILCESITVGCVYKGIETDDGGVLTVKVQNPDKVEFTVQVGTMTIIENAYRLLSPAQ